MVRQEREEAVGKFVEQNIYTCQSMLVEACLKKQVFSIDDLENMYRPFDGNLLKPSVCYSCKQESLCLDSETGECESCFEDNQMPQEIFEWWLVTPWLSKQLLLEGQPILDNNYGVWWGRCTTGQAIIKDYIIEKIVDNLIE